MEQEFDLELPGADERRFDPADIHRLTIRGNQPAGWAHSVELDGRQLIVSEIQISMTAMGLVKAVITLPTVILDMDSNVITQAVGVFRLKESDAAASGR